ncbi:MAG: hypothetical protein KTQ13_02145 [Ferruginibacter sp.]|nr:hypothetical protein [Ferruginibacter sp.]MBU9935425.1 hypothetical protein [Ferruginibacter sp.]HQW93530.1 DUF6526 family protein [Ferruginibacter sp.]HQY11505.1 DUF6526 family protein [Ferruginibacter sp.]
MSEQNFKNHSRYVPFYHFVAPTAILALIVGSCINLYKACSNCSSNDHSGLYSASLVCLMSFVILIVWWYSRAFALRAQDRAIRAEENFRHFIATGKPLDSRLRMSQVIALRFAGDDEFVALAKRAAEENMPAKEIKMAIKNWKADHNRV